VEDTTANVEADLQEAERQLTVAQAELQRLQEAAAQEKHFRQLGEAMSEDMAELCPDTHRRLLDQRTDDDVIKDVQQYLALITLSTSKNSFATARCFACLHLYSPRDLLWYCKQRGGFLGDLIIVPTNDVGVRSYCVVLPRNSPLHHQSWVLLSSKPDTVLPLCQHRKWNPSSLLKTSNQSNSLLQKRC